MKTKIYYKRLIWVVFIMLYSDLFFYNCLNPYRNWFFSYIFTVILILWLCKEYYQKHLFFQPNFLPVELHNYLLRGLFALFFYSSLVFGITTIVWWHQYRIGLTPVTQIIGIILLLYSVFLREKTFKEQVVTNKLISEFYLSIILVTFSMALGYDSYFLILYAVIIGVPLVLLQINHGKRLLVLYTSRIGEKKGQGNKIERRKR